MDGKFQSRGSAIKLAFFIMLFKWSSNDSGPKWSVSLLWILETRQDHLRIYFKKCMIQLQNINASQIHIFKYILCSFYTQGYIWTFKEHESCGKLYSDQCMSQASGFILILTRIHQIWSLNSSNITGLFAWDDSRNVCFVFPLKIRKTCLSG